jgi:hypothetical protein
LAGVDLGVLLDHHEFIDCYHSSVHDLVFFHLYYVILLFLVVESLELGSEEVLKLEFLSPERIYFNEN